MEKKLLAEGIAKPVVAMQLNMSVHDNGKGTQSGQCPACTHFAKLR
jgi:hypothetical protein